MKDEAQGDYQSLDGMEFVYKRANSRTPRKAAFINKLAKRRKRKLRRAARRKRHGKGK